MGSSAGNSQFWEEWGAPQRARGWGCAPMSCGLVGDREGEKGAAWRAAPLKVRCVIPTSPQHPYLHCCPSCIPINAPPASPSLPLLHPHCCPFCIPITAFNASLSHRCPSCIYITTLNASLSHHCPSCIPIAAPPASPSLPLMHPHPIAAPSASPLLPLLHPHHRP